MACFGSDLAALRKARTTVDQVLALVTPDSLYERPIAERHRTVFYIGHLEAFDHNLLKTEAGLADFAPELDRLFAFGIDPGPDALPSDKVSDWPEIEVIADYRSRVREEVDSVWDAAPELLRHIAIEHRLMHAETLAYMLHNFPHSRLVSPIAKEHVETHGPVHNEAVPVAAGEVSLGKKRDTGFGQDNEFEASSIEVAGFLMDRRKVSNGEYLEFVRTGAPVPCFWEGDKREAGKDRFLLRRMFDCIPLPLDWPVWVTQEEASLYAAWRGGRLPVEAEWQLAASGANPEGGNFDARRFDPEAVTANPGSATSAGVEDLWGNGWEWTASLFRPFPGFVPYAYYPGYSADFFDQEHYVLKGASPRTDGVFTRPTFRNWFRKDYPHVFSSFRCVYQLS
ncbi:MAG: SUMF1/EgtB/PvdO family nonheme iron enzyme [Bryobacteraceae bacterium]|nr:SUMF1/EgtB/PvdO family nonheme iron enzyme [Bryobacteraceae bacterium]